MANKKYCQVYKNLDIPVKIASTSSDLDKSLRYILTKLTLSDYNLTRPELILAFTEYKSEKIEKRKFNLAKRPKKSLWF